MWTPLRPVSVTGVTAMGDTRWVVPAPVLVGAVVGLAWAASLRVLMAEFAGPESTFDWFGTFEGVLLPGLVVGALLGWAAHLAGQAPRWLVAAPLVFVLFTPSALVSVFVDGLGGGAIAVPLLGMAGGYALAGRGPRWARWAAGAVALLAEMLQALGQGRAIAESPLGLGPRGRGLHSLLDELAGPELGVMGELLLDLAVHRHVPQPRTQQLLHLATPEPGPA